MIPNTGMTQEEFDKIIKKTEDRRFQNYGYKVVGDRIKGYVDDTESLAQAIYFILSTERYNYHTVSDDFGVELWELYGFNSDLLELRIKSTIERAVLSDERVEEITNFKISKRDRTTYIVSFDVINNIGKTLEIEESVVVNDG